MDGELFAVKPSAKSPRLIRQVSASRLCLCAFVEHLNRILSSFLHVYLEASSPFPLDQTIPCTPITTLLISYAKLTVTDSSQEFNSSRASAGRRSFAFSHYIDNFTNYKRICFAHAGHNLGR